MDKRQYRITINAPREKVWRILWDKDTYPKWTSAFSESSNVKTDNWKKNTKVVFHDGSGNGMLSTVAENIENEFMSFQHMGEVIGGVEDTTSDKVKAWAGAHENYTLKDNGANTDLIIDMDISAEFAEMFEQMWPKALDKVKQLAEQ